MKRIAQLILISLITASWAVADQPMERAEVLQLLEQLCQQPSSAGWIQEGRVEAIHRFSDVISGEITETHETVTTDGDRFTWQTQITSGGDAAKSQDQEAKDFMEWNQDRTFVWNGSSYTMYFQPGNHAIVHEEPSIHVNITGPLKAGYIPWGQGIFTFENLSVTLSSGRVVQTKDGQRIQLSIQLENRPQMQFFLDPAMNNAVLSYTLLKSDGSKVVQTYGNFVEQDGRFIPMNILIDRYDGQKLKSSDSWEILSLEQNPPQEDSFKISLQEETLVEHYSPLLDAPVFYRHSAGRNIESLLEKRFITALQKERQNCGTVAAEQILSAYGGSVTGPELASLVHADSGDTSLYEIRQLIEQKGFYCLTVKTNINGLRRFHDAQILVYFPKKKHFVVLDHIDQNSAWVIDLVRQTFYYSMDRSRFEQEWSGIAMVVSDQPLSLNGNDKPVPDPVLKRIKGAADYSCSDLIQEYDVAFCSEMSQGTCGGHYEMWYERYACEIDTGGGYCDGTGVVGSVYSTCVEDPYDPGQCTTTGNYISRYLRACQP